MSKTKTVDSHRFLDAITRKLVESWIALEQPRTIPWTVRAEVPGDFEAVTVAPAADLPAPRTLGAQTPAKPAGPATRKRAGKYALGGGGIGLLAGMLLGGPIGGLVVGAAGAPVRPIRRLRSDGRG